MLIIFAPGKTFRGKENNSWVKSIKKVEKLPYEIQSLFNLISENT